MELEPNHHRHEAPYGDDHGDPWQASEQADASSWLLGYSDMMTLLFACFAVLFAYQKAAHIEPVRPKPTPVASVRPLPQPVPMAVAPSAPPAATLAVVTPAPQAPLSAAAFPDPVKTQPPVVEPTPEPAPASAANSLVSLESVPPPPPEAKPTEAEFAEATLATVAGGVELSHGKGSVRMEISDGLLFDAGSAELKPEAMLVLQRAVGWLGTQTGTITVEGHSDDRPVTGRYRSNWDLSAARASTVARSLIDKGIAPARLRAVGLADTQPRGPNDTADGRARNRRVSLVVQVVKGQEVHL